MSPGITSASATGNPSPFDGASLSSNFVVSMTNSAEPSAFLISAQGVSALASFFSTKSRNHCGLSSRSIQCLLNFQPAWTHAAYTLSEKMQLSTSLSPSLNPPANRWTSTSSKHNRGALPEANASYGARTSST